MPFKVVSSYTPSRPLKVVNNYAMQGATYNPQQTANLQQTATKPIQGSSPILQAPKYNPQQTATAAQISTAAAIRFRQEQDRKEAERLVEKKRLTDAFSNELKVGATGFLGKLSDKASFGLLRRQRGGRELAVKYFEQNEKVWGSQIMARQRNYEKGGAEFKDWVMQADTEAEYNKRVAHANWWLEKEYKEITSDIADFTKSQKELAVYSEKPLSGKAATLGRGFKDVVGGIGSKSWNALTWTASQPQRGLNTVKNFVNLNNLRLYYGGDEKKGGLQGQGSNPFKLSWNQLQKSYNATKGQRLAGFSKVDEAARLGGWTKQFTVNGKPRTITRKPSGVDRFRVKYGDDAVDMLADPLSWFNGAGSITKVGKNSRLAGFMNTIKHTIGDKAFKAAGKNKWLAEQIIANEFKKGISPNRLTKFVKRSEGSRLDYFFSDNKSLLDKSSALSDQINTITKDWKGLKYRTFAGTNKGKALANMTDEDAALLQKYINYTTYPEGKPSRRFMKQGFSWEQVDLPRGFDKARRRYIEDTARQLKSHTDFLHTKDLEEVRGRAAPFMSSSQARLQKEGRKMVDEVHGAYRKSYIPNSNRKVEPFDASKSDDISRPRSNWFNQEQKQTSIQSATQLFDSFRKRTNATLFNTSSEAKRLDKLTDLITEKKDISKMIGITKQMYKPSKFSKSNEFLLRNKSKTPIGFWKRAVLKFNPAWYVNNVAWNVPASVSAAGVDIFSEYGKLLTNKKYWQQAVDSVPEGVVSNIALDFGKNKLASKIEDTSRLATFMALKDKGFSDEKALKQVNRWLFDYGTKNWERPIKNILPFWNWQKSIIRLGATMPFHSPRSAKVYSEGYKQFYQRPYDALPQEVQTYTDPETGKEVTYDPRKFYKGKAKIGNNFYGLPFFAVNPETSLNFGVNPYALTAADYLTSSDRLGNKNTDRKAWTIAGERFPQVNLARAQANRNNKDIDLWFSQSGNSKWGQGWDKSKSNYKLGLDNNRKFYSSLKSFFGVPRGVEFNRAEFDTKKRLTDFNKDFFAVDWAAKEDVNYKDAQKEKVALAQKYGFDLQKDIYDGYWSKYDTATTSNTKRLKREAAQFNSPDTGWWRDYFARQPGSKTKASERRSYLVGKFDEWKRDHTFAKNPYYKLPKKGEINPFVLKRDENNSQARRKAGKAKYEAGKLKYARKLAYERGDWEYLNRTGGANRGTAFEFDGKHFKSAESRDKYIAGKAKYEKSALWREYYALTSKADKQAFLKKHPELGIQQQPTTQAEWDSLRLSNRLKYRATLDSMPGFTAARKSFEKQARTTFGNTFGRSKRLRYKS
jgi:hypothetical protein